MNKIGFGFLRLPLLNKDDKNSVDYPLLNTLVDRYLELGGDYFDTAYIYPCSEVSLRKSLVERHPRDSFRIANKLPGWMVEKPEDNLRFFNEQLERCGVDYFDIYLIHALDEEGYAIAKKTDQFPFIRQLKEQGLAKKIGFSFHDSPELLDQILTEQPGLDYVQLQINYLDWENPAIASEKCYQIATKHNIKVLVMEPVKGGNLVNIPQEAQEMLAKHHPNWTVPGWAIRFAASLEQVEIVLSGMNQMCQIEDNLSATETLGQKEFFLLMQAAQIIRKQIAVDCTGCGYCLENCPQGIPIPQIFALYNEYARYPAELWKLQSTYDALTTACIQCGSCTSHCPQKLPIPEHLAKVSETFAKK